MNDTLERLQRFLHDCREVTGCGSLAFRYDDQAESYYLLSNDIPLGFALVEEYYGVEGDNDKDGAKTYNPVFRIHYFSEVLEGYDMLRLAFERLLQYWFSFQIETAIENAYLDRVAATSLEGMTDAELSQEAPISQPGKEPCARNWDQWPKAPPECSFTSCPMYQGECVGTTCQRPKETSK